MLLPISDEKFLSNVLNFLKYLSTFVILFGIIEYLLPLSFWESLKISYFNSLIGTDPWANIPLEHSGRFFSWDLLFITDVKIRRSVSIFGDPTLTSAFLYVIVPFLLYIKEKKIIDYFLLIGSIILGFLTISKAFFLGLIAAFFFKIVKINVKYFIFTLLFSFLMVLFFNNLYIEYGYFAHFYGFSDSIKSFKLFGYGLGKAGNYSIIENMEDKIIGGESGLGTLIGSIGIFSLIFIYITYSMLKSLQDLYFITNKFYFKSAFVSLFTWWGVFIYSESSMGITGNTIIFLLIGILLNSNFIKEALK